MMLGLAAAMAVGWVYPFQLCEHARPQAFINQVLDVAADAMMQSVFLVRVLIPNQLLYTVPAYVRLQVNPLDWEMP